VHGFAILNGAGARLERALINFMLELHTREHAPGNSAAFIVIETRFSGPASCQSSNRIFSS